MVLLSERLRAYGLRRNAPKPTITFDLTAHIIFIAFGSVRRICTEEAALRANRRLGMRNLGTALIVTGHLAWLCACAASSPALNSPTLKEVRSCWSDCPALHGTVVTLYGQVLQL